MEPSATTALEAIRRAKPFIDAGPRAPNKWLPSHVIGIGFSIIRTSDHPGCEGRADKFVSDMLDEARDPYAAGFYADPFMEPVVVRPAAALAQPGEG